MENTYSKRDVEIEEIRHLVAGNIQLGELFQKFPHWAKNELRHVFGAVVWLCQRSIQSIEPIKQVFKIRGKIVYVTFPYEHDEKTMSLVRDMLSRSHAIHHINAANQQTVSGTQKH